MIARVLFAHFRNLIPNWNGTVKWVQYQKLSKRPLAMQVLMLWLRKKQNNFIATKIINWQLFTEQSWELYFIISAQVIITTSKSNISLNEPVQNSIMRLILTYKRKSKKWHSTCRQTFWHWRPIEIVMSVFPKSWAQTLHKKYKTI